MKESKARFLLSLGALVAGSAHAGVYVEMVNHDLSNDTRDIAQ